LAIIDLAHFLNKTIACHGDIQFERFEAAINTYNDLTLPQLATLDFAENQANRCVNWPVTAAPITVKDPVSSAVPTLILQGAYDNRTPVYMGRRAHRELENSTLVLIPQQGHEIWVNANNCAGRIARDFILNPQQAPDTTCLEARRPQWVLP
jgi:pimeloyl-ACP methyl ester carboxylesterase